MKKIAVGCDHAGFSLKTTVISVIQSLGLQVIDKGCHDLNSVDYPDFAQEVSEALLAGEADRGVLICGSGIGMALTANRFKGVRAASITDVYSCEMSRRHNDLNVLCLGARVVGTGLAERLLQIFLTTEFEGGRHQGRLDKITKLENV